MFSEMQKLRKMLDEAKIKYNAKNIIPVKYLTIHKNSDIRLSVIQVRGQMLETANVNKINVCNVVSNQTAEQVFEWIKEELESASNIYNRRPTARQRAATI